MRKHTRYWFLLISLMLSQTAFALRCGSYVIGEGMYKNEVYNKCGQPSSVQSHIERRQTGTFIQQNQPNYYGGQENYPNNGLSYGLNNSTVVEVVIEEWIYNFGSSSIQQYLRFENGSLKEIRNLGRGYRNR